MLGFGSRKERKEMKKEAKREKKLNKIEEKELKLLEKERKSVEPMLVKIISKRLNRGEKIEGVVVTNSPEFYLVKTTENRYFVGGINLGKVTEQAVLNTLNPFMRAHQTAKIKTILNRSDILGVSEDALGSIILNTVIGDITLFRESYFIKEKIYEEIQNLL